MTLPNRRPFFSVPLAFTAFCWLGGCTVAPSPIKATKPSISGNQADSGVVGTLPDGSYELRPDAVTRYNRLILAGYSNYLEVPLHVYDGCKALPDGNYSMDREHVDDFAVMNSLFKSPGYKP